MATKKKLTKAQIGQVRKALYQGINDIPQQNRDPKNIGRGYQITTLSNLISMQGVNNQGDIQSIPIDEPYFYLSAEDRERIAKLCTPVLGVVTSRMQRISGSRWVVTRDKKEMDKIYSGLKSQHDIFKEFEKADDIKYLIARAKIRQSLQTKLIDLLPDLSNFQQSVLRWKRRIESEQTESADAVTEWIKEPGRDDWADFVKKWVFDLMIHGSSTIYKEWIGGKIENIYMLPGGSTIPFRTEFVSSQKVFIQLVEGRYPLIYNPDEISYATYVPISSRSYGLIPLEALVNKVSEVLMFDRLMAEQADGTRFPEKMIIVNDNSPFGGTDMDLKDPIDMDEQRRVEGKINTKIMGGVMTFTGNAATVVDLTRENTMQIQNQRQKDIREDVAFCFNMSNMEVNLTGGDDTSGRSTSEAQSEIDQGKGIIPIQALLESKLNREVLPFRFGTNFTFEFQGSENESKELERQRLKLATGLYSVNEIRTEDLNLDPFSEESYDLPPGAQPQPDGSEMNPMNVVGM